MAARNDRVRCLSSAFTLIELLVVVAIIAMLISVLLPSLAKAREQAKSSVCMSRLKNLGWSMQSYQTDGKGFFPGSPLTSGYHLAHNQPQLGVKNGRWSGGMPLNPYDYTIPLLRQMNVKLAGGGPEARPNYFKFATIGPMECPSNNQVAVGWNNGSIDPKLPVIRAISYLTMNTMVRGGPDVFTRYRSQSGNLITPLTYNDMGQSASWEIIPPNGYTPRVEAVGVTSVKVFLADGLRFYDNTSKLIDYDYSQTSRYGFHTAEPPCDASNASTGLSREYGVNGAAKYSYRHQGGKAINAVMFDGHAEPLLASFKDANTGTGRALHPKYYFPSRSVVKNNQYLFLRNDIPAGTALQ